MVREKKTGLIFVKVKKKSDFSALYLCFCFRFVWFLVGGIQNSASNLVIPDWIFSHFSRG